MRQERSFSETDVILEENGLIDFQFALIDAMNEAGINKSQLAKAMGVSRSRVAQLFGSEANPTIKLMSRAMAAVKWGIEYAPINKKCIAQEAVEISPTSWEEHWVLGAVVTTASDSSWRSADTITLYENINSKSEKILRVAA